MFIPPILYEKYPDIETYDTETIERLFNEVNDSIAVDMKLIDRKPRKTRYKKAVLPKRKKVKKVIKKVIPIKITKEKYNSEFKKRSKVVREKYKVCQDCNSDYYLMVHHIDKDTQNNSYDNLRLLCFNCHKKHHKHLKIPSFMKNNK